MGGDLTVRSTPGVGSSFFLWLPVAPAEGYGVPTGVEPQGAATSPGLLEEVRRELEILREELGAAIRRRVRGEKEAEVERAAEAVGEFVAAAERVSLAGYGEPVPG